MKHGICACIAACDLSQALERTQQALAAGATLVEYRLDLFDEVPELAALIAATPCDAIVTCRRPEDGGRFTGPESERRALLEAAIDAGAAYVDLEIDAAEMPRRGKTQRIVSYHSFEVGLEGIDPAVLAALNAVDADIIKLVVTPQSFESLSQLLLDPPAFDRPSVVFGMGAIGGLSRVLCLRNGAPWTYAALGEAVAPGQFTVSEMTGRLAVSRLDVHTKLFGIIGDPVAHSLSPKTHNAWFERAGHDAVYLPVHVPRGTPMGPVLSTLKALGFEGLSVTIPHKSAVLEASQPDALVAAIGASNTLSLRDGQWRSTNTDAIAAADSLCEVSDTLHTVLILGAGGVARAIAYALKGRGLTVTLTGRTAQRAEALAAELGVRTVPWAQRSQKAYDAVINGTPVGMAPLADQSPLPTAALRPETIYFDTVYTPAMTLLLQQAQAAGATVLTGVDMFRRQAALQFEIFTGAKDV